MAAELIEPLLVPLADALRQLLETLSVITVLVGLLASLRGCRPHRRTVPGDGRLPPLMDLRLRFGGWLSLALEFQLGADIVATTISPSRDNLIQLAVVAVIRTFLNVFLARELEAERRLAGGDPAGRDPARAIPTTEGPP